MRIITLFFAILFLLGFINGQEKSCVTSECHKDMKNYKVVHAPVEDDCLTCHEKTGDHKFVKITKINDHCVECHDEQTGKKNIHEAVSSGDCTDCHFSHGGDHKAFLKKKRIDTLCFDCHDSDPMSKKFVHGPNASGNCSLCHESHSSDNKFLLVEPLKNICTRCHSDKDFSGADKKMHSPMKEGCSKCHNPHSADHKFMLIADSENLCAQCHKKITDKAGLSKIKHPVVNTEKKCYNCHDAHGSLYENNLKISPLKLCLNCHDKKIIGTDGKDYNIHRIVTNNKYKHGPIKDGNCSGCHDPHGSDFYKILKERFPKEFYTSYDEKKYASCFECHEKTLARTEKTTALTDFRDGDRNLHYVHINLEKGRTCRACHEIHASNIPKHIRRDTPFGKWSLPIGFEKTKTGGSCAPGCHKAYDYDRNKKVKGL
ncbi:MAG: cytochrome c3 family protein [Acidobacteriota bacterium]